MKKKKMPRFPAGDTEALDIFSLLEATKQQESGI